jgi:hypothetical protein
MAYTLTLYVVCMLYTHWKQHKHKNLTTYADTATAGVMASNILKSS